MRVALLLIFGVLGGAGLLVLLLHREVQFPFVTVVKTAYRPPFPPNGWAYEDLESIRSGAESLHGKTIDVVDFSDADRTASSLLLPAPDQRRQLLNQARQTGVIVFYISLHGLVDDAGRACLAAPDASPFESKTWLPVSQLLRQIQSWELPDRVRKLLVLDCNRQETNWNVGLIENAFAAGLQQALDETPVPNLVILNSTSPGQTGWATLEMRGSVFGQFLRLGLAGAADLPQEGGNHDRRVSLQELHRYLLRHVDGWAQENRGARQQPLLIPANPPDCLLTCSLDAPLLQSVLSKFASDAAAEPTVSPSQLDEFWIVFAELRGLRADSVAPLEMGDLRRRLAWLEQASRAGAAYRLEASAAERDWRRLAERLRERLSRPASRALAPQGGAEYGNVWVPGLAARLHSLPLLARMGRIDPSAIDALASNLKQLQSDPAFEKLDALLTDPVTRDVAGSVSIVHFLKLLRRSQRVQNEPGTSVGLPTAALELQTLADAAAVPNDPRTQSWIRRAMDFADLLCRGANDALLTGGADSTLFDAAVEGYATAAAIDQSVGEALALTDVVAAELPDLARWLEAPELDRETAEPPREETANALLTLIAAAHRLAASLDEGPPDDAAPPADNLPFRAQYQAVRLQYQDLRQQFDAACEHLVSGAKYTPSVVRRADLILELPLLSTRTSENGLSPIEQRRKIHTLAAQAARDLHRRSMDQMESPAVGAEARSGAVAAADEAADDRARARPAGRRGTAFPLLALLEPVAPPAATADDAEPVGGASDTADGSPAAAGARVRRILNAIPAEVENARKRHLVSADQPRREWERAARLARFAAPFIDAHRQIDPVAELQHVDIQQILLWQAERYLEDFWGPAQPGEPSFFETAAADSMEAARALCIPNPATAAQISELKDRLAHQQQAARQGLAVRADALLLLEVIDHPAARVTVAVAPAGRGLPPGRATLRIDDHHGNLLGPVVEFAVDPVAATDGSKPQELEVSLGAARRALADTVGAATALFRGHEFRDELVIRTAAGTTVEARPRQIRRARIRLNGNKRQRASVVFILDCSASMRKEMAFESAATVVPRMEVAKAALVRMLNALAARGDARVGVLLYGHRIGWSTKEANQLLTQATWGGAIPEGLKPYEDVETILPLGRFDSIAAAKVAQRLEKVKPWGETPLYLSLTQALQEFKDDDPDAQRSVVVVTDGVNYQFNPRPDKAKTVQDVLAADASRRIPLHIVGFGIQPDEAQEAQREFGRLASETGGHYVSVSEAAALADTLEDILERRPYAVVSPAGRTSRAPIGSAIDLAWEGDEPQDYSVAIDALSQPVELTGGEAVELFVSQNGQSMLSAAYDAGAPRFAALTGGSSRDQAEGIRLGVHQPVREGTTVTFDLSLQHVQQRFVRRPREAWIEITPILSTSRAPANLKYVIYDLDFVPQTPVPVLRAVARDWPRDARRARIDFWCKWTATEPSLVIPLSDLPESGQPTPAPAALDGIPGLKYQARQTAGSPLRVDFIETYGPEVSGETMVKVDIASPIVPARTQHQFDEANRFATHSFLFENASESALRASASIRVISRRRMLDDACRLEVPVLIEVPAQSDTLPGSP
jgi:Mg-chelatase subunit ChlD